MACGLLRPAVNRCLDTCQALPLDSSFIRQTVSRHALNLFSYPSLIPSPFAFFQRLRPSPNSFIAFSLRRIRGSQARYWSPPPRILSPSLQTLSILFRHSLLLERNTVSRILTISRKDLVLLLFLHIADELTKKQGRSYLSQVDNVYIPIRAS